MVGKGSGVSPFAEQTIYTSPQYQWYREKQTEEIKLKFFFNGKTKYTIDKLEHLIRHLNLDCILHYSDGTSL